jgi:hypothetical protein
MPSFTINAGDRDFEVEVVHATLPSRGSWNHPGDGGEVYLAPFATVSYFQSYGHGYVEDVVTYETAVREFAAYRGYSLAGAERLIEDLAMEHVLDLAVAA